MDFSIKIDQATGQRYMAVPAKGRALLVDGRLRFDSWTGQDGQKRSKLSVVAENFQFIGGRGEGGGPGGPQGGRDAPASAGGPPIHEPDPGPPAGDDIPF